MQRERSGGGGGRPSSGGGPRFPGGREDRDQTPSIDLKNIVFGQIKPTLYSDVAEDAAKAVSPGSRASKNKPTQLRRFYDELVMLQEKVGSSSEKFAQQEPFIQLLKAKVAYAKGREKVDANFEALLRHVVDQIKDHTTLKQAKLFMEAFMAFYKVHGPKD
jgi:CRISPR-associated protein Csm2